jgi:hypothetical protein
VAFREGLPRVERDAALSGSRGLKSKGTPDRAASVRARLLNLARQRGEDFQITLRNYLFERFLYRLGRSPVCERFVLKGAMPTAASPPYSQSRESNKLLQRAFCGAGGRAARP